MVNINLVTVGKIKEKFFKDAIIEYSKRLSRYCKLTIYEVEDEKTIDNPSDIQIDMIIEKEALRLMKYIKPEDYVITMELNGNMIDSIQMSNLLSDVCVKGSSTISFVIGGSLGLHKSVSKRSNYKLSFGKITYPHQLMRVIMLEQIYRCFKIQSNEPYHK